MRRLGALSDEATPVFADLGDAAPDINRMIIELGPFSKLGIPAVESLGDASVIGTPAIKDALPVTKDLRRVAKISKPVGTTAAAVLESFKRGRGVQRLLDYVFYQVAAVNGFDSFGHYLRARLILNTCSRYYTAPVDGCSARFASVEPRRPRARAPRRPATPTRSSAARPPRCRARTPTASRHCLGQRPRHRFAHRSR